MLDEASANLAAGSGRPWTCGAIHPDLFKRRVTCILLCTHTEDHSAYVREWDAVRRRNRRVVVRWARGTEYVEPAPRPPLVFTDEERAGFEKAAARREWYAGLSWPERHVVDGVEAAQNRAPKVWVPFQFEAWLLEGPILHVCPECLAPKRVECFVKRTRGKAGRFHMGRVLMYEASRPPGPRPGELFEGVNAFGHRLGARWAIHDGGGERFLSFDPEAAAPAES